MFFSNTRWTRDVDNIMTTSRSWWMLETLHSSTLCLMPHRCSLGFRSGDMLDQSITFTLSFLARQWSLSCWNTALRPSLRREGIMLCLSMSQYMLVFMVPSMSCSSPVLVALMQPQTMTLPPTMLDCRQDTLVFVFLTWLPPQTLDTIWNK